MTEIGVTRRAERGGTIASTTTTHTAIAAVVITASLSSAEIT